MNCTAQMINCDTGEILYTRKMGYVFDISRRPHEDAGMRQIFEIIKSTLKGTRIKNVPLCLQLTFNVPLDSALQELPFIRECDESITKF